MQFEWDEAKNIDNIHKHQIDFADIPEMFEGPMLIELDERFDYGEDRWSGIGFLHNGIEIVIWTERQNDIISARRANRHERQKFEQYLSY